MLGAVLPEMRAQAEALAADLAELLRRAQRHCRPNATVSRAISPSLVDERLRMNDADRAAPEAAVRTPSRRSIAERQRADRARPPGRRPQGPDRQARSQPRQRPRAAHRAARAAEEDRPGRTLPPSTIPAGWRPAVAFASARGPLPLPVNGVEITEFGAAGRPRRHRKRAFPSPPAPARRLPRPATAGWFTPGRSAAMANS